MTDLKISIPSESNVYSCGPYTPIDELPVGAMCDNYIYYDNGNSKLEKVTIDEAIEIIIKHKNHMYLTRKNMWCIHMHSLVHYLSIHKPDLYQELENIIDTMDPNPCKEFIYNEEKPEREKKQKEELRETKRKETMGQKYNEYLEIKEIVHNIKTKIILLINDIINSELSISNISNTLDKKYSDKQYKHGVNELKKQHESDLILKKLELYKEEKEENEREYNKYKQRFDELCKEYESII